MLIISKKISSQVSMSKNYNLKEMYNSMEYVTTCHWNWMSILPVLYSWPRKGKNDWQFFFFPLNHVQCFSACRLLLQNVRLGVLLIMVFIAVLEARSPRSGCQHGWVSEGVFQDISLNRRDEQLFQPSFKSALILFMWALPTCGFWTHDLIIFKWSHHLKSLLWGLGFQHINFGRTEALDHGTQRGDWLV